MSFILHWNAEFTLRFAVKLAEVTRYKQKHIGGSLTAPSPSGLL